MKCSYYNKDSSPLSLKATHQLTDEVEVLGPIIGPNISAMRNHGATLARGKWVLFIDHDCEYSENQILRLKDHLQKETELGAFSGVYKQKTQSLVQKAYDRIQRLWVMKGLEEKSVGKIRSANHLLGGCLIVQKSAWQSVGGFDEKIGWGGEETEFVQRLKSQGYKTGVTYRFRVQHNCNIGIFGFLKRAWVQNFNRGFYQIKKINNRGRSNGALINYQTVQPIALTLFASVSLIGFCSGTLLALLKPSL